MARIICLANSEKLSGRCIAGIEIGTGTWVRPVSLCRDTIYNERFIDGKLGREPQLLDLVEIPIESQAPDKGCQPENRYLGKGNWRLIRRLSVSDIFEYIENEKYLLHNKDKKVDPEIFNTLPKHQWRSLQLISVTKPCFKPNPWNDRKHPICTFVYSEYTYELKITDPIIIHKIKNDAKISEKCLFTVSMATPFKSPSYEKPYCWKMVAGVIEL